MEKFLVHGGQRLSGSIDVKGAKNAAFPLLASSILTTRDVVIRNLPLIEDVHRFIELLESMGATVDWIEKRTIRVNTKHLEPSKIDKAKVKRLRGSIVLFGPLLARFGRAVLPYPGGCSIGVRPIDTHLDAFVQLGASVTNGKDMVTMKLGAPIKGNREVTLNEFSVTATENMLLFAAGNPGTITIKIADFDYQVQELAKVLRLMGAEVRLNGLHEIVVRGSKNLKGIDHRMMYDPTEAGTFILMGASVPGRITVKNVELRFLDLFIKKLKDFGVSFEVTRRKNNGLGEVAVGSSRGIRIDKIQCFIYPGLHSDLQSPFGVLATQAKGPTLLHDPLYAGRLKYLEELNKMGAEIFIIDPHRAIINGPTPLYGTEDLNASDLRGGMALVIASLFARGTSTLTNIYQIDRGYETIETRLREIGADITRMNGEEKS